MRARIITVVSVGVSIKILEPGVWAKDVDGPVRPKILDDSSKRAEDVDTIVNGLKKRSKDDGNIDKAQSTVENDHGRNCRSIKDEAKGVMKIFSG